MRRLLVGSNKVYQVRPSFMMPYQIGKTAKVEEGLYMYISGCSFEAVVHNHGRNAMYWWRAFASLGRNSLVGTTIKSAAKLPRHLLADEKHTQWYDQKVYLATTIAEGVILGAALSEGADAKSLSQVYSEFEEETQDVDAEYFPKTINTDGWNGTKNAWQTVFGGMAGLLLCFLHGALKIRNVCRRWERKKELMKKVWDCYHAKTLSSFSQRIRRLREWCQEEEEAIPESIQDKVLALCERSEEYKLGYWHQEAHRTSNMLDRLMDWQDRFLYRMRYLHSKMLDGTGRLLVRAMALAWNFHPFCRKTGRHSPFDDLNGFVYHSDWLDNMMIAASLGGRRYAIHKIR